MLLSARLCMLVWGLLISSTTTTVVAFHFPIMASSSSSTTRGRPGPLASTSSSQDSAVSATTVAGLIRNILLPISLSLVTPTLSMEGPRAFHVSPTSYVASAGIDSKEGLKGLNNFLASLKTLRSELESDKKFDGLAALQKVFDVDTLRADCEAAFSSKKIADQTAYVEQRKIVDKILRQVFADVILIEDTIRPLNPEKTGAARMKKINAPFSKLESDMKRLTQALTTDDKGGLGLNKPLFTLCPDGYLLCEPQD